MCAKKIISADCHIDLGWLPCVLLYSMLEEKLRKGELGLSQRQPLQAKMAFYPLIELRERFKMK
jgi:hypothetical protein